jgi:hypothetical protein
MAVHSSRSFTNASAQDRRFPFRLLSLLIAAALLVIIIAATVLPNGVIQAFSSGETSSDVVYTIAEVPAVVSSNVQSIILEPAGFTGQKFAAGPLTTLTGGPTDGGGTADPPVVGQGGTCIEGYVIDRYHERRGEGWKVWVIPADGEGESQEVDSDGEFIFEDLDEGIYTVELEIPDGWREFTPASFSVTLNGEEDDGCAEVRFKVEALPCLIVNKKDAGGYHGYDDLVGLPDWEITASNSDITLTQVTDGQGKAYFYDLVPDTWVVTEGEKIGWQPVQGDSPEKTITLNSPVNPGYCEELTFINEQVHDACIVVSKTDTDGVPLSGWKITLSRDDGTQPTVYDYTDSDGVVYFKGLPLGQWTVTETLEDWYRPVDDKEQVAVNLETPGYCEPVNFTNEPLGCIDGYKINHLEEGLEGWEITAINEETGEEFTDETDEDGYFKLEDLPLGTYRVVEEIQEGWEAVTPSEITVEVDEAFVCEQVRFKNKTNFACLDVYKVDDYDGSGIAGWEITVGPRYGDEEMKGETDGTGWVRFNGLTPGEYTVSEEIQDGWHAVSDDSYDITLDASGTCHVLTFVNRQESVTGHDHDYKYPPDHKGGCYYYEVEKGDTLYEIAYHYDTTVNSLMFVNELSNSNDIYVGQVLCIP